MPAAMPRHRWPVVQNAVALTSPRAPPIARKSKWSPRQPQRQFETERYSPEAAASALLEHRCQLQVQTPPPTNRICSIDGKFAVNSRASTGLSGLRPYSPDLVVDRSVAAGEKGLAAPVTFGPQPFSGRSPMGRPAVATARSIDLPDRLPPASCCRSERHEFSAAAPWWSMIVSLGKSGRPRDRRRCTERTTQIETSQTQTQIKSLIIARTSEAKCTGRPFGPAVPGG